MKQRRWVVIPSSREKQFNLSQQTAAAFTGMTDERRAFTLRELQCGSKDFLRPEPQFVVVELVAIPQGGHRWR